MRLAMNAPALLTCLALLAGLAPVARATAADEATKDAKVRVACVGDSITYGAGVEKREQNAYPVVLQALLGDRYEVRNFGVSGATMLKAGDKPYWKEKAFAAAKAFNPDVVVIKLGTNDSKPQNWKHKDQFAADAAALVAEFQALPGKPKVYLCRPVPVYPPGAFGIREAVVKDEVLPLVDAAAKETGATVIDLHAALSDQPKLFPDKVHPNAAGAKVIAETVHAALTKGPAAKDEKKAATAAEPATAK